VRTMGILDERRCGMRMKGMIVLGAALSLGACDGLFGSDDSGGGSNGGAVFTMNNSASANYVVAFSRDENGVLARVDSVATGGKGSGPDPTFGTDPLASQDAVILSDDHSLLFVVNAGSNEVSSFRVGSGARLTLASRVSSGGVMPVSLAMRGNLLYVVNGGGAGSISGFTVATDGTLTPLSGSTRPLSGAATAGPGSIRISPSGQVLVVTEKPNNKLDVYVLGADGRPAGPTVLPSPGPTPFGADFDAAGRYVLSQGNVGPNRAAVMDGSSASSLTVGSTASASVLSNSVPTTETAACWVQITPDGRYAYTTNTGSGSITGFSISSAGVLTRLTADGRTGVTGTGTQPLDMAYAGGYLYALTPGDNGIHVFKVESDGSLTAQAGAGVTGSLPISVTGLAAM
jgi:6-phosphogluconolactonase